MSLHPMHGPNRFKLGVFAANADGGLTVTRVPERWPATWPGIVQAAQIADRLRDRYVQNPQVSIFVTEFRSQKVSLLGAVSNPSSYPLMGQRRLLQLLAEAGSLAPEAGGTLYVFRQTPESGAPRAPFCMMGACYDCLVAVEGVTRQACMMQVRAGLVLTRPKGRVTE